MTESESSEENNKYLSLIKSYMLITGVAELRSKNAFILNFYKAWGVFFKLVFFYMTTSMWCTLPMVWGDKARAFDALSYGFTWIIDFLKFVCVDWKQIREILKEIDKFEEKVLTEANKSVKSLFQKYYWFNRILGLSSSILVILTIIMVALRALLQIIFYKEEDHINDEVYLTKHPLLFVYWLPFDMDKHYILVYIINLISVCFSGSSHIVAELTFLGTTISCLFRLDLLKYFIRNLDSYVKSYAKEENVAEEEAYKIILRKFIIEHSNTIEFVENATIQFKYATLFEFCGITSQSGILLFHFSRAHNPMDFVFFGCYIVLISEYIFSHLYLLGWLGNEIIIKSIAVADELFLNANWENHDNEAKILINFSIFRAQKPLKIVLGPLGHLSLETSAKITKASFSYLAFFQSMR